jgi:heme-degrading monooxygenase HmoA
METILIDTFRVPQTSRTAFLDRTRKIQGFIRTLPGFVEGYFYEKTDGDGRTDFLTTAVWESEEAFENAKKAVAVEYRSAGADPGEVLKTLGIETERAIFRRSPY